MLDENKHIDSLFADGLKGMSTEPSPEVWNAISSKMAAARRKRRGVIIFISAALAASVLLFFGIANRSLFTSEPDGFSMQQLSEISSAPNTQNSSDEISASDETLNTAEETPIEKSIEPILASNTTALKKSNENVLVSENEEIHKESLVNTITLAWQQLINSDNAIPESIQYQQVEKTNPIQLSAEELIIQNNLLAMEQAAKEDLKKNRWAIIGQLSSAYSNEESAASASSGIVSFGGGVKVNYALGKKLALQTGFMYNSFGQDIGGSRGSSLLFSDANAVEGNPQDAGFIERRYLPANTTAGNINYTGEVSHDANTEYMVTLSNSSTDDLLQTFETIEVPFLIRYSLTEKRLGVYVSGGFGANWIIDNGVYSTSGSKRKIGEIENLRTTNFSSLFGLGVEYKLSPKIQIGLEPSFKYYLNSINKSSQFNYKPYSIGIHTGIRYNF